MRRPVPLLTLAVLVAACGSSEPTDTAPSTAVAPTASPAVATTGTVAVTTTVDVAVASTTAVREAPTCVGNELGDTTLTFASSGGERTAIVHVPAAAAGRSVPVLLDFHGHGGTAEHAQRRHGFDPLADPLGVITVYPQGVNQLDGRPGWHTGAPNRDSGLVDDVEFTLDLLDRLESTWCIDADRTWVAGHSNGGGMVGVLACDAAERIDAVAAVAGAFYRWADCAPARAVPFLELHGLDDDTVPYAGNALFDPVPEIMAGFVALAGCDPTPVVVDTRSSWSGCAAPVEHVALPGQGHAYPDDAAATIMAFFTAVA